MLMQRYSLSVPKYGTFNFFSMENEKDVVKIAKESLNYARENNDTVLIFDTAGRLQIDTDMMAELLIIDRIFAPHEKLLVIDSPEWLMLDLGVHSSMNLISPWFS